MANGAFFDGSPCSTASIAPLGRLGGASPNFTSAALMNTGSGFAADFFGAPAATAAQQNTTAPVAPENSMVFMVDPPWARPLAPASRSDKSGRVVKMTSFGEGPERTESHPGEWEVLSRGSSRT
jgi:hypothetical protein